ncbi:MAG TPA: hypothetical protein VMT85_25685 [Thermoanaerobaculia bacterium]|nr:hypothetical protein [Thermoanaerobaculia bacterium]
MRILVAKGSKRTEHAGGPRVSDEAIDALLGPTGNLRAPTVRVGDTLLVGFDEDQYREALR